MAVMPDAIAGSSMGALVALSIATPSTPLVLIAPALGIADRWLTKLPAGDPISVYNHARVGLFHLPVITHSLNF